MKAAAIVALVLAGAGSSAGYVKWYNSVSAAISRRDYTGIYFCLSPSAKAGLRNSQGEIVIVPGSDPRAAIQAALDSWSKVPGSAARFQPVTLKDVPVISGDGINTFSFADTPANRSVVGDAIAVTTIMTYQDGTVVDTDIIFNPAYTYAGETSPGAFDIQQIATHELGHALGAGHYGLPTSVMYPGSGVSDISRRALSADDVAFVKGAYPASGALAGMGSISGSLSSPSGPVQGAEVIAVDPASGIVVGTISNLPKGGFQIWPLQPGNYYVYAQPVDQMARAVDPGMGAGIENFDWQPAFCGPPGSPALVTVKAGASASAEIALDLDPAALQIYFGFVDVLPSGSAIPLQMFGKGFDPSMKPGDLLLLGPGLSLQPGSLNVTVQADAEKSSYLGVNLKAEPRSDWPVAVIGLRSGESVIPGPAMRIAPPGPLLTGAAVVNAASYRSGSVAPGEILTLFGLAMGPASLTPSGLDGAGRVSPSLGGVSVDFDGVAAPLFYVSPDQINLQAPAELAGKESATMRISYNGESSAPVLLSVAAAQPAIFFGAVSNQDGSLNSSSNPGARGTVVVLYGTGQGAVDPPLMTGQLAPVEPLSWARDYRAYFGDIEAPVRFAGMTPGFAGLLQMNIFVPRDAPVGDAVPLRVEFSGVSSPDGPTVAIR